MRAEHRQNDTDRENPKYCLKTLSHYHSVLHKSHTDWAGIDLVFPRWQATEQLHESRYVLWIYKRYVLWIYKFLTNMWETRLSEMKHLQHTRGRKMWYLERRKFHCEIPENLSHVCTAITCTVQPMYNCTTHNHGGTQTTYGVQSIPLSLPKLISVNCC
jgi:hypothetical protein